MKTFEIMAPLKCLSNFWKTLEMPLINCEINLILTWCTNCVIVSTKAANQITQVKEMITQLVARLSLL